MFGLERLTEPAGPSLRRAGRLFHLDHIFGRGVDVHGVGVERTVIASDHWPLWVDAVPATDDQPD
jgi:endonuclease/exonuclease/phosphatase (EEP) superfamily protein YafD